MKNLQSISCAEWRTFLEKKDAQDRHENRDAAMGEDDNLNRAVVIRIDPSDS